MSKGKVLIIDDNPNVVKLLEINLNFEDYEAASAYDGKSGLEKIEEVKPDLIILDVIMPKMSGWEVLEEIKSNPKIRNIPVIMLTGSQGKDDLQRGYSKDIVDYVAKPFNTKKLIELINDTISKKTKEKEPDKTFKLSDDIVNIAVIGAGDGGISVLRTLSGNSKIQILAYADANIESEGSKLAKMLNILSTDNIQKLLKLQTLNIVLDLNENPDVGLKRKFEEKNIEYLGGRSLNFIFKMLEEKEVVSDTKSLLLKELNLRVKELSVLYDVSKFLNSRLDLKHILEGAMRYLMRIIPISGCCVYLYDPKEENFILENQIGLPEKFAHKILDKNDAFIKALEDDSVDSISSKHEKNKKSEFLQALEDSGFKSADSFPLYTKDSLRGFFILFSREEHSLTPQEASLVSTVAAEIDISIDNAMLNELAMKRQKNIETLLSQLIYAQEDERRRIASEIHDGTAQSLVAMLTKIQTSIELIKQDPERAKINLLEVKNVIVDNVKEIRQIIFDLRPTSLDDLGLISAIQVYVNRFKEEKKMNIVFKSNVNNVTVPPPVSVSAFRIVQESLNNIARHSKADKVEIDLKFEDRVLKLDIIDNGRGFDLEAAKEKMVIGASFGITGMQERVSMLNGTFDLHTKPNEGTKIAIKIPTND